MGVASDLVADVGAEDPMIATFEIDSAGTATSSSGDMVSTPSANTVLTARVTDVRKAP